MYSHTTSEDFYQSYGSSGHIPTVPNVLKFHLSEATGYQNHDIDNSFYQQFNEVEQEPPKYTFTDEGSKFFNNSEIFPTFIKDTVDEFSNPAGEDGKFNFEGKLLKYVDFLSSKLVYNEVFHDF